MQKAETSSGADAEGLSALPIRTLSEIPELAKARLSKEVWDYSSAGGGTEATLRRNRSALDAITFRPRVLRGVVERATTTAFLGTELALPVMPAPVGGVSLFDDGGALSAARAAHACGTASFVSTQSSPALEEVAAGSEGPLYFQLYVEGDRNWVQRMIGRVEDAGYRGLCVTVDTPVHPPRERDTLNAFVPQEQRTSRPNTSQDASLGSSKERARNRAGITWPDIALLKTVTSLPLMLKGIMDAEDAAMAVEHGVDVVYVSNHGGRQLDFSPATIEVLPEIVEAVAGRATILIDGGFTRGTDVVKALALGADAVLIGKLQCWALAAGGAVGLEQTLRLLADEISTSLAMLGVGDVRDLDRSVLRGGVADGAARP